jgi:rhamnose utilization protein RhaD (predicted bifunctional aldolase and dehydrogenase)
MVSRPHKKRPAANRQDELAFPSTQQSVNPNVAAVVAALSDGGKRPLRLALTTAETCAALAISPRSLKRLSDRGLLKPSMALRTKMWPVAEIIRFLETTKGL